MDKPCVDLDEHHGDGQIKITDTILDNITYGHCKIADADNIKLTDGQSESLNWILPKIFSVAFRYDRNIGL